MFEPIEPDTRIECPHCEAMQSHDDDFCHACGHGFTGSAGAEEHSGDACPVCLYGEIHELSYGIRQCESCGYTAPGS